jgi:hypothetical protein
MFGKRVFSSAAFAVIAVAVLSLLVGCGDGHHHRGIVTLSSAPWFRGVQTAAVAGPSAVHLAWDAAIDDRDSSGSIRYYVYAATTSGGQNFSKPLLRTSAGDTSVIITNRKYGSISAGTELFFVVRAVDTEGNIDTNQVEISLFPVLSANVVYVDDSAAGPGTGTLADPFTSIQAGVSAVQTAGGGVALVAEGTYNEKIRFTTTGTPAVAIIGGFPNFSTLAGASEQTILAARDVKANETIITGDGLSFSAPEGLIEVFNSQGPTAMTPTFIDGFTITESDDRSIRGEDVDLQVSGCKITDGSGSNTPNRAIDIDTTAANIYNNADFVGNEIDSHSYGIEFGGGSRSIRFGGNFIHDISSNAIESQTSLGGVLDSNSIVIPMGATTTLQFLNNEIVRNNGAIDLDFEPESTSPGSAGYLRITFLSNYIAFTRSGNAIEIDDIGFFGDTGSAVLTMTGNYIRGASSDLLEIDFMEGTTNNPVVDGPITIEITKNHFLHGDSDCIEISSLTVAPASTTKVVIDDNVFDHADSDIIGIDDQLITGAGAIDGGKIEIGINRNSILSGDDNVDIDVDVPPNGEITFHITDNDFRLNHEELIELDSDGFCATPVATSAISHRTIVISGNKGNSADDDGINLEVAPCGGTANVILAHNELSASEEEPFEIDIRANPIPGNGGTVNMVIFNNLLIDSDDESIDLDDYTAPDEETNILIAYNTMVGGFEDDANEIETGPNSITVMANNEIGMSGDDTDDGLDWHGKKEIPGYSVIRNNILAFTSGHGIDARQSSYPQIVNNTLNECGQYSTSTGGINSGGSTTYSQLYVANSIVYRSSGFDLDDNPLVRAIYSLIGDENPPTGFGNIWGDPIFTTYSDIRNFEEYFRLNPFSPAIDAGNPSAEFNDPDGTRNDMGAFGGPGAGQIGYLGGKPALPLMVLGIRPLCDLFAGYPLLATTSDVTLVFSKDVAASTVNANSIVFSSGGTAIAGTLTTSGKKVVFRPSTAFTAGSIVTVQVSKDLKDTEGNNIAFAWQRSFAVESTASTEVEPNDATSTAQALSATIFRVSGDVSAVTDEHDYYSFSANAGERLMATVFSQRGALSSGDLMLTLLDGNGTTILSRDAGSFGVVGSGDRFDPYIDYTFTTSGTFYLLIEEETGSGGPYDYELEGWVKP